MMFGDNETVVNGSVIPHAKLHKRHTMLSMHRLREAAAATKLCRFTHIPGDTNPADILSKHWDWTSIFPSLRPLLFWRSKVSEMPKSK